MPFGGIKYKVYFTPKSSITAYGDEIDVTDYITIDGLQKIRKSIDSGDYTIGTYTYDDINLNGYNLNGIFNDENDNRSIFKSGRDLCKVRIEFVQYDDTDVETATISFRGLINEEASRIDAIKDTINFKVLSLDSVIRTTKVPSGTVTNGMLVSEALLAILTNNRIELVLNVSSSNINPNLDIAIDNGTGFDDLASKDAIDSLLLISNSVMIIDSSQNIIIRSRDESTDRPILFLYGKSDIYGRENILDIKNYNSGYHRVFTSVVINETEKSNSGLSSDIGVRQVQFDVPFITDSGTESSIANRLLNEFKSPKTELEVTVPIRTVLNYDLLDRVSINYPLRVKPPEGKFLPVVGTSILGDTDIPLPFQYGSLSINPRIAFKIIQIEEDPRKFLVTMKLRQIGVDVFDGQFNNPGSFILGFAILGDAELQADTDPCETWNPSVLGAAMLGCTDLEL